MRFDKPSESLNTIGFVPESALMILGTTPNELHHLTVHGLSNLREQKCGLNKKAPVSKHWLPESNEFVVRVNPARYCRQYLATTQLLVPTHFPPIQHFVISKITPPFASGLPWRLFSLPGLSTMPSIASFPLSLLGLHLAPPRRFLQILQLKIRGMSLFFSGRPFILSVFLCDGIFVHHWLKFSFKFRFKAVWLQSVLTSAIRLLGFSFSDPCQSDSIRYPFLIERRPRSRDIVRGGSLERKRLRRGLQSDTSFRKHQ